MRANRFLIKDKLLLFFIFLFVSLGIAGYFYLVKDRAYVVLGAPGLPQYKIEIPSEIVKSKDCEKYRKWAEANFDFGGNGLFPMPKSRCPWSKPVGPVGRFIIDGTTYWIPRAYITFDPGKPDGVLEEGALNLSIVYPEMRPIKDAREDNDNEIIIFLKLTSHLNYTCSKENIGKCNYSQYHYEGFAGVNTSEDSITELLEKVRYIPELNATLYKSKKRNREIYIQGSYIAPNYWFVCTQGALGGTKGRLKLLLT